MDGCDEPRYVRTTDGLRLATYERGPAGAPTVLAVHGYPDNHSVWDGVAQRLAEHFRVVSYDVRGCGNSDAPPTRPGYRLDRLIGDLATVLDASGGAPVHLLAHDWGSIQAWAAVVDERLAGRVATFTSISGPSPAYTAAWVRAARQHPGATLRQLAHSWYIALFQLPRIPELIVRGPVLDALIRQPTARGRGPATEPRRTVADRVNGLELYRANLRASSRATPVRLGPQVPVQVIVPRGDRYVTEALAEQAPRPWVADLTVTSVAGGHWVLNERPDVIAQLVRGFVDRHGAPIEA